MLNLYLFISVFSALSLLQHFVGIESELGIQLAYVIGAVSWAALVINVALATYLALRASRHAYA